MALSHVTAANVRAALRAVRYGKPLSKNPLTALAAVTLELRREGMPDTHQTREWCLAGLMEATIERERTRLGSPAPSIGDAPRLRHDFDAGVPDLECWAALHARYMAPSVPSVPDLADSLGLHERTLERRVTRGHELLAEALADLETHAQREIKEHPGAPPQERIVIEESAPATDPATTSRQLRAAILDDHTVVHLNGHTADAIARLTPSTLDDYRLGRIAEWSKPRYSLDRRFVQLTMLVDAGDEASDRWLAAERFGDLADALRAVPDRALVLLGPPGAGKSTLLRRLELDLAIDGLRAPSQAVTFYVPLNLYRSEDPDEDAPAPGAWLSERWSARHPELPSLDELAADGRLVLLLDALNEMPHRGFEDYHRKVTGWKTYLHRVLEINPANQVVFSCRSLDYSAPLSSAALRVPQVVIEPMSDDAVHRFLTLYSPSLGEGIWQLLRSGPQLEIVRTPYFCRLLVEQVESDNRIPAGRAALFTGFVRHALRRELERDNAHFTARSLLTERDLRRILSARPWRSEFDLPTGGDLVPALQRLAFGMQTSSDGDEEAQVRVPVATAHRFLAANQATNATAPDDVVRAGVDLAILDEDVVSGEMMFFHQLLQEYFAARELAESPDPALATAEWRAESISPGLAATLADLDATAPLPPLPSTGWEETSVLAAGMAVEPDRFVLDLAQTNLALAGRAAAEPEARARLSPAALDALRRALSVRAEDPSADLRARLDTARGSRDDYRQWRIRLLASPALLDELYRDGRVPQPIYEDWKRRIRMSDSDFEHHLLEKWPDGPKRLPEKWFDPDFSNPSQPVVGISWYEASAYCLWVSAQMDAVYRLPLDNEWMAAACGSAGRPFPWGDRFDPARCNVKETRLRRPSPVGVFVEGDTPDGVADMAGNVAEWLAPEPLAPPSKGHATSMDRVSLGGGSWGQPGDGSLISSHDMDTAMRGTNIGFRLVH